MRFVRRGSPRIVIDTNVLISATISAHGASARILDAVRSSRFVLVVSSLLVTEFDSVVHRSRIATKYPATVAGVNDYLEYFKANARWTPGIPRSTFVPSDPKDDMVIACAVEGDADYIISGDHHLTELKEIEDIPILTPADFVRRFKM